MDAPNLIAHFEAHKILKADTQTKSLVVLGKIRREDAILTLEKTAFAAEDPQLAPGLIADVANINTNDIYSWNLATLVQDLHENAAAKVNLVYPATETHIRKYQSQELHMVSETPEMYTKYVEPWIATQKGERLRWVHNILFEGKEAETFVHHERNPHTGFVLLPDMKWDRVNLRLLYLIAIVNRGDISSVRDLRGADVDFLQQVRRQILAVTEKAYLVPQNQLRLFVHYQPSYYHFHIHVVNVAHPGLGDGINAGKAILLDTVIENIELMGDYYQRATMHYQLGENHGLWELLSDAGAILS